jgi:hypothetical protein
VGVPEPGGEVKEVHRVEGFEDGSIECIRCGRNIYLAWNGGELDSKGCRCGLEYSTEHVRTDLVVYDPELSPEEPVRESDSVRELSEADSDDAVSD